MSATPNTKQPENPPLAGAAGSVKCPKCAAPATYIRTRPFGDGSGIVFMCDNAKCKSYRLYFYAPPNDQADGRERKEPND